MTVGLALLTVAILGQTPQEPPRMPPAGSAPVVRTVEVAFPTQGNVPLIDPQTYLYYIQTKPSRPSLNTWEPYNPKTAMDDFRRLWDTKFLDDIWIEVRDEPYDNGVIGKHIIFNLEERQRVRIVEYLGSKAVETSKIEEALREENVQIRPDSFLDLATVHRVETLVRGLLQDKGFQYANVTHELKPIPDGQKLVRLTFQMEEGPKVKIKQVTFTGNDRVSDRALARQLKENRAKPWWMPGFLGSRGAYYETKFETDADRIVAYYRDHGYVQANVGAPHIQPLDELALQTVGLSPKAAEKVAKRQAKKAEAAERKRQTRLRKEQDKLAKAKAKGKVPDDAKVVGEEKSADEKKAAKTRWVELQIPITEGQRYRVGDFVFDGVTVMRQDALRTLFKLKKGDYYREGRIRKGLEKARELYGSAGYFEFTGYPDLKPRETQATTEPGNSVELDPTPAAAAKPVAEVKDEKAKAKDEKKRKQQEEKARKAEEEQAKKAREEQEKQAKKAKKGKKDDKAPGAVTADASASKEPAVVDVTMRMQEGKQYFINKITFNGNTTTRDNVIRREMALYEGGVFNTEALKYSIKRLNQLGYFKPIEDQKGVDVKKAEGQTDRVNVGLKVEEQNRNQLQFGAGYSEYDGVFGNFSYTVASFLGRGESVSLALQRGSRSTLYQFSFSEPYLMDQPISLSADLYSRKNDYYTAVDQVGYSEVREGATLGVGRPIWRFLRGLFSYTYEVTQISISNDLKSGMSSGLTTTDGAGLPSFNLYLDGGHHRDSRIAPALIYNSVDQPMMPHKGMRVVASASLAGTWLGGSYNYFKPDIEGILYLPTSRRTGFGMRAQGGWLRWYGTTSQLPYYLRYYLGGEYQIRGVNIRTVGPVDSSNRMLGGNKFVLFNVEYYLDIAGPVRAVLFHDAGQAFAEGDTIDFRNLRTSSGAELRVVMPMVNVPFRLIWARNFYRDSYQPAWVFKFAVGTTF
jgi:outer membrane protein assembly factor BamA